MHVLRRAVLLIAIIGMVAAAFAQAESRHHALVTVMPETKARLVELHGYSNLDIVGGETPDRPRVVARPEDLEFLTAHGYAYEIVYPDVEQFYANRLASPTLLMGGYKTYAEIQTEMDAIHTAHPGIATAKWSIGATLESRQQWVMLITNLADSANAKPEVFYNSLIHAREPEAMECNFYFMNWLTDNYGTDPMATYLVDNRRMYFLPCVNPDGYEYNRSTNPNGGGMWRKNRKLNTGGSYGIDLNRNFDAAWGIDSDGSSPTPSDETYRGTAPFSELETQHIRDFVNSRHFVTEQDFHTYQNLILIPWGTSYYPPPSGNGLCPDDMTYRMIIDSMAYFIHGVNSVWYTTGTPWETLYNTNGGSFDWEYENASHQKIYALTTEVGGASDGFWPPTNRILPLAQENLPASIFLARIAGMLAPRPYQVSNFGQCESELSGNGNGVLEPGEEMNFNLTLKNIGLNALNNVQGQLTTSDPYLTVTSGTANWPDIAANATGVNGTPFQLSIAGGCPAPHFAPLSLHITATGLDTTLALNATVGNSAISDNVEGGVGNWTTTGVNNQWHISTRRAQSATHSWFSGAEAGNYSDGMSASLVSPVLILGPGAEISYDQYFALETGYDYGYFEANYGTGWTLVGTAVTGTSGGWVHVTRTLSIACAGTPVQLRFRMTSDAATNAEGWYIDNISTGCPVAANVSVGPASVTAHAPLNGTDTQTLSVCNIGGCPLTWTVTYTQTTPFAAVSTRTVNADATDAMDLPVAKGAADTHFGHSPLDNMGGPDGFGYVWKDSSEPTGPTYNWVELVGLGTRMTYSTDDQTIPVTLPWAFPLYGQTYTTAQVSANGNIHFSADTVDYGNRAIPSGRLPNAMLAPFWDDLSPQLVATPGGVYYYNDVANSRFIVQYDSVAHYTSLTGRYTFEAILYSSGRIVFQYQSVSGAVNSCTVGIESTDGLDGLQVVYNAAYLVNNLAIEFKHVVPWLTLGGTTGSTLDPTQCANVTLNFAAGTLTAGTYTGQLTVASNDPVHNPVTVPLTFVVGQLEVPQEVVICYDAADNTLVFTWQNAFAPHYRVYSSTSVSGPFDTLVGSTTTPTLTIPAPASLLLFYRVVSSDQ